MAPGLCGTMDANGRSALVNRPPEDSRDTVAAVALTGVDLISVGRLTHSARSVDISMEIVEK